MTLKKQLIIAFIAIGMIPFLILAFYSSISSQKALEEQAHKKLESVRALKKSNIQTYLQGVDGMISSLGTSGDVVGMFKELVRLHNLHNVKADGAFDITDYPDVLEVYNQYEPQFKKMVEDFNLYDIFIVCRPHGHVMYTVAKESDLGENLGVGTLKDSGLAEAWRKVVDRRATSFVDMRPYAPSNGEPAMFMGTPILEDGNMLGVIIVQLSPEVINSIMQNQEGLGRTEESYLVGADMLARSDMLRDPARFSILNSFKNQNKIETISVKNAISGKSGIVEIVDVFGNKVLSSYSPLDMFGVTWAMIVDIEKSEVDEPIVELYIAVTIAAAIFLFIIIALALYLSSFISKPVIQSVKTIAEANSQVLSASDQIAASSQSLAEGASEQASSVEEVSATIEQSTAINNQNAENGKEADSLAGAANKAASTGGEKLKNLMVAMEKITDSSQRIAKIIKTIDEIAFQTNLLALNAAVEAARAGEHGLGFAVVADEVKNLAQRSADAAKETAKIIEEAIEEVKNGNQIAKDTDASFSVILEKAKKTSSLIGEISVSIKEQAEGMNQVATAMGQIDQVTQQNAANSEEAAAAAEELNAQALAMMESVKSVAKIVGYDVKDIEIKAIAH